jgi:hypothetical protein
MTPEVDEISRKIVNVAIQGETVRGSNGAVLVDTDSNDVLYLLSHEFKPAVFCEKLNEMLSEDGSEYFYVVHKSKDSMHISKLLKK